MLHHGIALALAPISKNAQVFAWRVVNAIEACSSARLVGADGCGHSIEAKAPREANHFAVKLVS